MCFHMPFLLVAAPHNLVKFYNMPSRDRLVSLVTLRMSEYHRCSRCPCWCRSRGSLITFCAYLIALVVAGCLFS